ncbi:MAG: DUF2630 family protein [Actinomycetota bacterium]|nr:DUF2630 family protein [Actinomycetota bacterium]
MSDETIKERIESLVDEEQRLLREATGTGPDESRHARLEEVKVELDRCWDLLRQRQGREEFDLDPDAVHARDADTVERYKQ